MKGRAMRRMTVRVIAVVALAALLVPGTPNPGRAADELLSQGKPVRASAVENNDPELVARHAVDGSPATRWASAHTDPSWIWVDLGEPSQVRRIEIDWEAAYSTAYSIQVSDDAASWKTIATVDPADGGADVLPVNGTGRYVRLLGTARNGIAGHSLWELRVFGSVVPKQEEQRDEKPERKEQESGQRDEPEPEQAPAPPPRTQAPAPAPSPTRRAVPERDGPPGSVVYYVVRTKDGEPETIESVAGRFLADEERWPEIADLTRGHRQPDGRFLTDPHELRAGWVLRLPQDADGKGVRFGLLPGFEPSESPSPSPSPGPTAAAGSAESGVQGSVFGPVLWPVLLGLACLLVLTGLVLAALRIGRGLRRRRQDRTPFDDSVLRTDTSAAWTVDHALRALLAACEQEGLDVPGVTAVFVEGSTLRLQLTNPSAPAPAPWSVSEDGQNWAAPLSALQSAAVSAGSTERFAHLVNLGMGATGRVLVDFSVARGVVSLDGPVRARHEVLRRWLGEFTGNPWSGDPRVVLVGDGLPRPEQVEHMSGFEQVVPELEVGTAGVLVLSGSPSASDRDFLARRFAEPEFGWVVIVLGSWSAARWRFTAGDDGWLRGGFLPDVRVDEQASSRRGRF